MVVAVAYKSAIFTVKLLALNLSKVSIELSDMLELSESLELGSATLNWSDATATCSKCSARYRPLPLHTLDYSGATATATVKCSAATLAATMAKQKLLEISKYLLFCHWDLLINI